MKPETRQAVEELLRCSKNMRDAANALYWANNPDEVFDDEKPLTVFEAQQQHSDAFRALNRAEYYVEKALRAENP